MTVAMTTKEELFFRIRNTENRIFLTSSTSLFSRVFYVLLARSERSLSNMLKWKLGRLEILYDVFQC